MHDRVSENPDSIAGLGMGKKAVSERACGSELGKKALCNCMEWVEKIWKGRGHK